MPRNDDPNLMKFRVSGLPMDLDRNQVQQELEQLTGHTFEDCFYIGKSKFEDAVDTVCFIKVKPEDEQKVWLLDRTTILNGAREARVKQLDGPPGVGNLGGGGGGGGGSGFKRPNTFDNGDSANKRTAGGGGAAVPGPTGSRPAVCLCYATIDATGRHIWAPLTDPVTFDSESLSRWLSGASTINGSTSGTVNQYFTSSSQPNGAGGGGARGGYTPRGGRGGGGAPRGGGGGYRGGFSGGGTSTPAAAGGGGGWDDEPAKSAPAANGDVKPAGGEDDWGAGGDAAAPAKPIPGPPAKAAEPAKEAAGGGDDDW